MPAAVIGASPGQIGTALAQQSLRAVLSFCNARQMTAPEAYITLKPGLITDDGEVTDDSTAEFLVELHAGVPRPHRARPHGAPPNLTHATASPATTRWNATSSWPLRFAGAEEPAPGGFGEAADAADSAVREGRSLFCSAEHAGRAQLTEGP